jgi:hypothetical protein
MAALVPCRDYVYYQAEWRAAIGGKCDAPEGYTTTQTENTKQLPVACSECTFTVYCRCSDNILDRSKGGLETSSVHMKACCLLFVHLWNKCFQNG